MADAGSGLGAPAGAAGDDQWFHQHLIADGQGFLGFQGPIFLLTYDFLDGRAVGDVEALTTGDVQLGGVETELV